MNYNINLAIQVLPLHTAQEEAYSIIDKAIEVIKRSGLKHVVCPFETVIEGSYTEVMKLVDDIQDACKDSGAKSLLINMKLHRSFEKNMAIDDKIGKYSE
jgi:uncharacterized protein YqgV (UPF0045/DUF77 family)